MNLIALYNGSYHYLHHVSTIVYSPEPIINWFKERNIKEVNINQNMIDDDDFFVGEIVPPMVYVVWFMPVDADCDFWFDDKKLAMEFKLRFSE